jgi:hypothetical protein
MECNESGAGWYGQRWGNSCGETLYTAVVEVCVCVDLRVLDALKFLDKFALWDVYWLWFCKKKWSLLLRTA